MKLLSHVPDVIGASGFLLLGTDLVKDVDRLEAAGALVLGKAACTEFAYFGAGPTRNPVTGVRSGHMVEQCYRRYELSRPISRVAGDPFNLSSGSVPDFDLRKCQLPPPMKLSTTLWSCTPR